MQSCECVTNLDTPQEITPTEGANIIFFNSINTNIKITTRSGIFLDNLAFSIFNPEYKKIAQGNNYIRLFNTFQNANVFNSPIDLKKDKFYSMFSYTDNNIDGVIVLNDTIPKGSSQYIHFRIINLATAYNSLIVVVNDNNYFLNKLDYLDYDVINKAQNTFYLFDSSTQKLLYSKELTFTQSSVNTIVIFNKADNSLDIKAIVNKINA